jgi:hypothetical protein
MQPSLFLLRAATVSTAALLVCWRRSRGIAHRIQSIDCQAELAFMRYTCSSKQIVLLKVVIAALIESVSRMVLFVFFIVAHLSTIANNEDVGVEDP